MKGNAKMKRTVSILVAFILVFATVFTLVSCNTVDKEGLWEEATYRRDMEFGNGSKTLTLEVKAGEDMVTFTVKTDKDTVGAALLEHGIIEGKMAQYGIYIKKVNGITADYDADGSYWAFYIDGEYAMSGVDSTEIDEGAVYRLEYAK